MIVANWPRCALDAVVWKRVTKNDGCGWRHSAAVVFTNIADALSCRIHSPELFRQAAVFLRLRLRASADFRRAFSGRNVEGVPFDFADDVFLLHFALEPAERALQRLVIAEFDFCHLTFHLPFNKDDWMFHRAFIGSFSPTESAI